MSKLLLDSQPLVIIPELACVLGLNEAIIFQQIHYWLEIYRKHPDVRVREDHCHNDMVWVYNSIPQWCDNFPFLAQRTIERAFASLKEKGLLYTDNFNKLKQDRTIWYSINYEKFTEYEEQAHKLIEQKKNKNKKPSIPHKQPSRQNGGMPPSNCRDDNDKMGSPLPEITTEITTEIENNNKVNKCKTENTKIKPIVVVSQTAKEIVKKFKEIYKTELNEKRTQELINTKGIDTVTKYLDEYGDYLQGRDVINLAKDFYACVRDGYTLSIGANKKDIPQYANFDQRDSNLYDDDRFFANL